MIYKERRDAMRLGNPASGIPRMGDPLKGKRQRLNPPLKAGRLSGSPLGSFKLGRKTRSSKISEVIG